MDKAKASPVVFVHNDPIVFGNNKFFETLDQFVGGLPIDIYVFDATDYFQIRELLEKDIETHLIYEEREIMYDYLACHNKVTYDTLFGEMGYVPLSPSMAFGFILEEAAKSLRDSGYDKYVNDLLKIYKEVFGEPLF